MLKGIVLAGGEGTRLYPATMAMSKHLLPVYDKPMVYYPISTLMLAGIQEILIISSIDYLPLYKKLLGTGQQWGLNFCFAEQKNASGIAEALLIGEEFIANSQVALILGDNIFFGEGLQKVLLNAKKRKYGATIYGYKVPDSSRYGVVEFDFQQKVLSIEEKPTNPKSPYAVPGLYFYDQHVAAIAHGVRPSERKELEITSVNQQYLQQECLNVEIINTDISWFDAGTIEAITTASKFVQDMVCKGRKQVGCPEETAWRMGFIDNLEMLKLAKSFKSNPYGNYLRNIVS